MRIEHAAGVDERTEALHWLARRVRWERFLTSLHEDSPAADGHDEVDRSSRAA